MKDLAFINILFFLCISLSCNPCPFVLMKYKKLFCTCVYYRIPLPDSSTIEQLEVFSGRLYQYSHLFSVKINFPHLGIERTQERPLPHYLKFYSDTNSRGCGGAAFWISEVEALGVFAWIDTAVLVTCNRFFLRDCQWLEQHGWISSKFFCHWWVAYFCTSVREWPGSHLKCVHGA